MSNKKKYPLAILKSLEEFVDLKGEKFIVKNSDNYLIEIVDIDENSNFSFLIKDYKQNQDGRYQVLLERNPYDENNTSKQTSWISVKDLKVYFNLWLKMLEQYENVKSFFDDPILKFYQEEYLQEFEINNEEAFCKPLTSKQILLIDDHLNNIVFKIDDYRDENNGNKIDDVKNEISILRENITINSKIWVLKSLTRIWAKLNKLGPKFMREFLSETNKEIVKQGVKALIDVAKDNFIQ